MRAWFPLIHGVKRPASIEIIGGGFTMVAPIPNTPAAGIERLVARGAADSYRDIAIIRANTATFGESQTSADFRRLSRPSISGELKRFLTFVI